MTEPASQDELRVASKLLALAAGPALRPVDFLIAEAQSTRDEAWTRRAFDEVARIDIGTSAPRAIGMPLAWNGDAPLLESIEAWRVRAKFAFESAEDVHARNGALLVYGWCIAAALVHFGRLLTSQSREDVDQLLAGIATALPEPLAALPRRALLVDVDAHEDGGGHAA